MYESCTHIKHWCNSVFYSHNVMSIIFVNHTCYNNFSSPSNCTTPKRIHTVWHVEKYLFVTKFAYFSIFEMSLRLTIYLDMSNYRHVSQKKLVKHDHTIIIVRSVRYFARIYTRKRTAMTDRIACYVMLSVLLLYAPEYFNTILNCPST